MRPSVTVETTDMNNIIISKFIREDEIHEVAHKIVLTPSQARSLAIVLLNKVYRINKRQA